MKKIIVHKEDANVVFSFYAGDDLDYAISRIVPQNSFYIVLNEDEVSFLIPYEGYDIVNESLVIDIIKAKNALHRIRRSKRYEEFYSYDAEISKQIPGTFAQLEEKRADIRKKYDDIQKDIDDVETVDDLKSVIEKHSLK